MAVAERGIHMLPLAGRFATQPYSRKELKQQIGYAPPVLEMTFYIPPAAGRHAGFGRRLLAEQIVERHFGLDVPGISV